MFTRPMELRSSPCTAPRSVLETTITSSRCPRKETQSHWWPRSSHCRHFRVYSSALLVQSAARTGTLILTVLGLVLALLDSLSAQAALPYAPYYPIRPVTSCPLAKHDLLDLPVDCPQRSCRMLLHRCHGYFSLRHASQALLHGAHGVTE